ncbi:MAG: flagellar biosynthesis protein FlgA [Hyphomicrobiaceae bacterium]|nr:flagellar biosynthesis protein FlgA [Hyphomicrobiaceae bacterium]MCC0007638.1 flagellar biosynthesis protein FlgA [Hyphomicrobiaceae bacterium]
MNLFPMLTARAEAGRPIRIAQAGAGKFGTMFLAQARLTMGLHVAGLADLDPGRARQRLAEAGWEAERMSATSLDQAMASGATFVTNDAEAIIRDPRIEVVVEATGDPATGVRLARLAFAHGKSVVMVNVEADALVGPLLAEEARRAGVVYSLAWGDQPALIAEHVDWARACGFAVIAAGKGTRYLPSYHASTPETVWDIIRGYLKVEKHKVNLQMFNSFIDGTKSAIEMTAVCNACDLQPQAGGLTFPPASRFELAELLKPKSEGGLLEATGVTEVVSSLYRDGRDVPHHLAMGTYVVVTSESDYARRCFSEYAMLADKSGTYAALYRPTHMIGLELGISVASVALRREPTGTARVWNSDVAAVAKRALKSGEMLDGEGGFTVWGRQMPAAASRAVRALPIGLAHRVRLVRDVEQGAVLTIDDVALDAGNAAVAARAELVARYAR